MTKCHFTKQNVMDLTRRQLCLYLQNLSEQTYRDKAFEAKLHGFKMKAPIRLQVWSKADDERITSVAKKRFDKMAAEAEMKSSQ